MRPLVGRLQGVPDQGASLNGQDHGERFKLFKVLLTSDGTKPVPAKFTVVQLLFSVL